MSVKFLSAILGPEMAAPILWTPGKMRPFCRKNHVHIIPRFRGGGYFGFWGGGSADFISMGAGIFLILSQCSSFSVSCKQVIQDKNAQISYRHEGWGKQRPRLQSLARSFISKNLCLLGGFLAVSTGLFCEKGPEAALTQPKPQMRKQPS